MSKIPYINYKDLNEFYTIPEICQLFQMEKSEVKSKCEQYGVVPRRNEIGAYGLVKYDVRKLHNTLYHEDAPADPTKEDDPWA